MDIVIFQDPTTTKTTTKTGYSFSPNLRNDDSEENASIEMSVIYYMYGIKKRNKKTIQVKENTSALSVGIISYQTGLLCQWQTNIYTKQNILIYYACKNFL